MNHCRSIITGIFTIEERVVNHGLPQKTITIPLASALLNRFVEQPAGDQNIGAKFHEINRNAGILANRIIAGRGNFDVFEALPKYPASGR